MTKKILLLLLSVMAFTGANPSSSYAQGTTTGSGTIAPQPCDAQYWRQLSARAWLESEREIMQNQNLIFKPDSVLEYVCFDQFVDIAANPGGDIFVHTLYFGDMIIKKEQAEGMPKALTAVVSSALNQYQSGNFSHTYLGGRAALMQAGSSDYPLAASAGNKSYTCKEMSHVWKAAKCGNFVDNKNFETTDGFYPFKAIKGHNGGKDVAGYEDTIKETRKYPAGMECGEVNAGQPQQDQGAAGTWADQNKLAENNKEKKLYEFQEPLGKIFKEVGEKLEPGKCSNAQGIKTGVKVIIDNKESHDDGVCTNPGCTYTKSGTCS